MVKVPMALEPSPYASRYFLSHCIVAVQDSANACEREAVANAVAIHWDMGITRRYWEGEAYHDRDGKTSVEFPRRSLEFGDVENVRRDRYPRLIPLEKVDTLSSSDTVPITRERQWSWI